MATKKRRKPTPCNRLASPHVRIDHEHERINALTEHGHKVNGWIKDIRTANANEFSQLHSENNNRKRDCVAALRGVTGCEAAINGLRSDFETFAAQFDVRKKIEPPDVRGYVVPETTSRQFREATALFLLTPDETVSNAGLLDFIRVYAGDQTRTGKAIFSMAHELMSLRMK